MRIAFFISEDYLFTFPLLKKTLPELEKNHSVCGIIRFPDTLIGLTGIKIPLKYLELFGFFTTARLAIQSFWNRFVIYRDYLCRGSWCVSFKQMAKKKNIPYLDSDSPNNEQVIRWVKENDVDVIFIFIGQILKTEIINAPRCCIVNKHGSILPANRGVLPVFWAMLNDEKIGFSLHKVTTKLDSGEVLFQKVYPEAPHSLYEWYRIMYNDVPTAISEVIKYLEDGKYTDVVINNTEISSYHSLPVASDVKKFYEKELKII
jgi:folate-dependent phosphoribosylglycinamide formyltransferase PurN